MRKFIFILSQSVFALALFLLASCTAAPIFSNPTAQPTALNLELEKGYHAEKVFQGLYQPTQMILAPDGALWIAQLNGDENAGKGQVVRVGLQDKTMRVLLENLDKPTGIAILNNALWIQQKRSLLRAALNEEGTVSTPEIILNDLPFNTRSEGTLTVSPRGTLIFETSGNRVGNDAEKDSAMLWELDPSDPKNPTPIATGLKNAYAHTFDEQGNLWATEIADDFVNGYAPPDELNWIVRNENYGWPRCFGYRLYATNYGGTEAECSNTFGAGLIFPPHSTPTSIVLSPFDRDKLLVALWGPTTPSVVRVPLNRNGNFASPITIAPLLTGLAHPQHLLVLADKSLLVSDFETGTLYRITQLYIFPTPYPIP